MGEINLARVDERLIHGQVMLTLSQRAGVNSIFVVDDVVAKDKFMKDLYKSAGGRTGQPSGGHQPQHRQRQADLL